MKAFSTFLGMVFSFALLAALLAGGYFLFSYIVGVFGTLEPKIATVTAIASVVVLLSAMIVASGLRSRNQPLPEAANRDVKAQLYQQLLAAACDWSGSEAEHNRNSEADNIHLKQNLALWGSPEVIRAYAEFERRARQTASQADGVEPLLQLLVIEMRKDLGQTASNIKQDDLMYLLIGKSYR